MQFLRNFVCLFLVLLVCVHCGKKKKKSSSGFNVHLIDKNATQPALNGESLSSFPHACNEERKGKAGFTTGTNSVVYCDGAQWRDTGLTAVSTRATTGSADHLCDLSDVNCVFEEASIIILSGENLFIKVTVKFKGQGFDDPKEISRFIVASEVPYVNLLGFSRQGKQNLFFLFDKATQQGKIVVDENDDGVIDGTEPVMSVVETSAL